jgi:hypothetical protein
MLLSSWLPNIARSSHQVLEISAKKMYQGLLAFPADAN